MGTVSIQKETTIDPISLVGREAGVCWGADVFDIDKNYQRGLNCIKSNHGRTLEYIQIYMILDGYSARVMREFYTHIGGAPTRLQSSTRYINYGDFEFIIPPSIDRDENAKDIYMDAINQIKVSFRELQDIGIPKEDIANILPLGMQTKVVVRTNLRNLIDMAQQRKCTRAYWEFRQIFNDIEEALKMYSLEWSTLIRNGIFKAKCEVLDYCPESKGCGRYPKKGED